MNSYLEFLQEYATKIYQQIFKELQLNRTSNVEHLLTQLKNINEQIYEMGNK